MKQFNNKTNNKTIKQGFTLIEILIVTGIIILLSITFLANYDAMKWQVDLNSEAKRTVSVLKQAQAMALTGKMIKGIRPTGYGVYFKQQDGNIDYYLLFADSATSSRKNAYDAGEDIIVQTFNLPEGIDLLKGTDMSIVFDIPEGGIYKNGSSATGTTVLELNHLKSEKFKQIRISPYGRIE